MPLKLWLTLDETSGIVAHDSSGNANHGTASDSTVWTSDARIGGGSLLASNGYVDLPTGDAVTGNGPRTIAMWVKTTATDSLRMFFVQGGDGTAYVRQQFGITASGLIQIEQYGGGSYFNQAGSTTYNDGAWHHVALTHDGTTERLYLDGTLNATKTATLTTTTDTFRVGGGTFDGNVALDGQVDDFRYYNECLSPTAVAFLAGAAVGVSGALRGRSRSGYTGVDGRVRGQAAVFNAFDGRAAGLAGSLASYALTLRGRSAVLSAMSGAVRGRARLYNAFAGRLRGRAVMVISVAGRLRGRARSADDASARYELFRGVDGPADLSAAPWQTFTARPFTTPTLAGGHTYQFVLRRRNRWGLASANVSAWSMTVDGGGVATRGRPLPPTAVTLQPGAGGTATLRASYTYLTDPSPGDTWLVYVTFDGTDPAGATPTLIAMAKTDGTAKLKYAVAAKPEGTTVRALVRVRRGGTVPVDSDNTAGVTCVATSVGPSGAGRPLVLIGLTAGQQQ